MLPLSLKNTTNAANTARFCVLNGLILVLVACLAGCESSSAKNADVTPPTSPLGGNEALKAAMELQDAGGGRQAGLGRGGSMEPLYDENSVLVISPIDFMDLERGMHVAYRNSQGKMVVHELIQRDGNGWIARGLGNDSQDRDRVTVYNLVGVVYGAFFATN